MPRNGGQPDKPADPALTAQAGVLISGGNVVSATDVYRADVLLRGEKIAAIGLDQDWRSERSIDAAGCYLFPGGIDVHTHLEHEAMAVTVDDFYTGTVAAAFGGTTSIIDFAKRIGGRSLFDSFERRYEMAHDKAIIDYGFHGMIDSSGLADNGLRDIRRLADRGVTSFKFLMAYPGRMMVDDGTLLDAMRVAAEMGLLITVHAENGHMVKKATERLIESGQTAEHMHMLAHPSIAEGEAAHRAIALSEMAGSALYIVHVSSYLAAQEIQAARMRGLPVWGETCPQYLFAAYEDYEKLGFDSVKYICSPPIRERANQGHLWQALKNGVLSVLATDHAAFYLDEDPSGNSKAVGRGYFPKVPNGVPGIEERLELLYDGGVNKGEIGITRFVDLVATAPAKLFGLYPRKGTIAIGSDADIVVWDPSRDHIITARNQHSKAGYSLYEGMHVKGKPKFVLSRGQVIIDNDSLMAEPGRGQYMSRLPGLYSSHNDLVRAGLKSSVEPIGERR